MDHDLEELKALDALCQFGSWIDAYVDPSFFENTVHLLFAISSPTKLIEVLWSFADYWIWGHGRNTGTKSRFTDRFWFLPFPYALQARDLQVTLYEWGWKRVSLQDSLPCSAYLKVSLVDSSRQVCTLLPQGQIIQTQPLILREH